MKTGGFFKSNWVYLLWCCIYILLATALVGATIQGFLIVLAIYGLSMLIALSPMGEALLRTIEGARRIATREEREFLQPLFDEVYEQAKEKNENISQDINLYILDVMYVNAFAMGSNTIAVTKGLMNTRSEEKIKGILAHEFGHIVNGDTKALLLVVIGNLIFTVAIMIFRIFYWFFEMLIVSVNDNAMGRFMGLFMRWGLELSIFAFMFLTQIILAVKSRKSEYLADKFAYNLGYGEELLEALIFLQAFDFGGRVRLRDRLRATHPYLAYRVERLERLINDDEN
jgi:heat shock protein HtpX